MSTKRGRLCALATAGAATLAGALTVAAGVATAASAPPFEPVTLQRIDLPKQVKNASTPVFTRDGRHIMFIANRQLWIVATNGTGGHCLTCGVAGNPGFAASEQAGLASEFPDRKRVFIAAKTLAVLECHPSVIDCASKRILPIELSGAIGSGMIAPGGVDAGSVADLVQGASPKLSPNGKEIAFSDVRSDVAELMIIARLTRTSAAYETSNPKVLNPPAPTSPSDTDTQAWSSSSGLYEFKTFADGGADATYVEVGGPAFENPDVWEINLKTGRRWRLTSYPDWDEDDAPSPDGRSIVIESDRTMHRIDMWGALMPVRDFVDDPETIMTAGYYVADNIHRQCDLQPWLLPASGDDGGGLMGQPLQPYTGGAVHGANNISGYPQWAPNGTAVVLNTESYKTNLSAPYLVVAHLTSRQATNPARIVDSEPGSWAPTPDAYHGPIGSVNDIVLHGLKAGTATVDYDNVNGLLGGSDSVVYSQYSDNGRDFVNGTYTISYGSLTLGPVRVDADLHMTGADHGDIETHVTFSGEATNPITVTGTSRDSYDGKTISGIPHTPEACPAALPRPPRLRVAARITRHRVAETLHVRVTASIAGAGPNETKVDTRPVTDATISLGGRGIGHTNSAGQLVVAVPARLRGHAILRAAAGDTLRAISTPIALGQ